MSTQSRHLRSFRLVDLAAGIVALAAVVVIGAAVVVFAAVVLKIYWHAWIFGWNLLP